MNVQAGQGKGDLNCSARQTRLGMRWHFLGTGKVKRFEETGKIEKITVSRDQFFYVQYKGFSP